MTHIRQSICKQADRKGPNAYDSTKFPAFPHLMVLLLLLLSLLLVFANGIRCCNWVLGITMIPVLNTRLLQKLFPSQLQLAASLVLYTGDGKTS